MKKSGSSPKARSALRGIWRIVESDQWDVQDLDLAGPAHLTLGANGLGELQLIAIDAAVDYRVSERNGIPFLEFSWAGFDDCDPASGRGWAELQPGGALRGMLFIHQGDESGFTAHREAEHHSSEDVPRAELSDRPRRRKRRRR